MKWIVGLLLCANIALFFWQRTEPPPVATMTAELADFERRGGAGPRLALLDEVDASELRARRSEEGPVERKRSDPDPAARTHGQSSTDSEATAQRRDDVNASTRAKATAKPAADAAVDGLESRESAAVALAQANRPSLKTATAEAEPSPIPTPAVKAKPALFGDPSDADSKETSSVEKLAAEDSGFRLATASRSRERMRRDVAHISSAKGTSRDADGQPKVATGSGIESAAAPTRQSKAAATERNSGRPGPARTGAPSAQAEPGSNAKPAAKTAAAAGTMTLAARASNARKRAGGADTAPELGKEEQSKQAPRSICYSVGPMAADEQIKAVQNWLVKRGAKLILREAERRELERYWVYFPPLGSRDEASRKVADMRAQGVVDISVLHKGDMANAISLGMFSRRETLERRLKDLHSKGHKPAVVPRYRSVKGAWFDVTMPKTLSADAFQNAFAKIDLRKESCAKRHAQPPAGIP